MQAAKSDAESIGHHVKFAGVSGYEKWKDKTYGVKKQVDGETFTLAGGKVVPVYRRVKEY